MTPAESSTNRPTMLTLASPHALEQEVKKSRFIARVSRTESREEAMAFLEQVREARANHNCWAFKIGSDYRFNDDGEPGGTAGQPILRAIEGQGLDHVVAVVTRYFGGIKLGAGGLVRAYGGCAAECLRLAPKVEIRPRVKLRLEAPFTLTGAVYPVLDAAKVERIKEEFTATGMVIDLSVDAGELPAFKASLRDATRGKAVLTEI